MIALEKIWWFLSLFWWHNDYWLTHSTSGLVQLWAGVFTFAGLCVGWKVRLRATKTEDRVFLVVGWIGVGLIAGLLVGGVLSGIMFNGMTTKIDAGKAIVTKSGMSASFKKDTYLWYSDPLLRDSEIIDYGIESYSTLMTLNPITSNPKVWQLHYQVEIFRGKDPEVAIWMYRNHLDQPKIERQLRKWLYDYMEHHSKELALYYNPYDEAQQKKFDRSIREYLQPQMEKVWGKRFRLETIKFYFDEKDYDLVSVPRHWRGFSFRKFISQKGGE